MEEKFPGFPSEPLENYWQYPLVCNGWWHQLSGAEQKVLDYLLRHTWGYQKYGGDFISIKQFTDGIFSKKKDRWIDRGTGLSKREVIDSLKVLEENGFIEKKGSQESGKTNYYKLKLDNSQPVQKMHREVCRKCTGRCAENAHTINTSINNKQYRAIDKIYHPYEEVMEEHGVKLSTNKEKK